MAAVGEREAVPGVIVCVQTFGSVAHLHPHLHVLLIDGAFRGYYKASGGDPALRRNRDLASRPRPSSANAVEKAKATAGKLGLQHRLVRGLGGLNVALIVGRVP
jgi:hypothetical protein